METFHSIRDTSPEEDHCRIIIRRARYDQSSMRTHLFPRRMDTQTIVWKFGGGEIIDAIITPLWICINRKILI